MEEGRVVKGMGMEGAIKDEGEVSNFANVLLPTTLKATILPKKRKILKAEGGEGMK